MSIQINHDFHGADLLPSFMDCFNSHFAYLTEGNDLEVFKGVSSPEGWDLFLEGLEAELETFITLYYVALGDSIKVSDSMSSFYKSPTKVFPFQIVMNHRCEHLITYTLENYEDQ